MRTRDKGHPRTDDNSGITRERESVKSATNRKWGKLVLQIVITGRIEQSHYWKWSNHGGGWKEKR